MTDDELESLSRLADRSDDEDLVVIHPIELRALLAEVRSLRAEVARSDTHVASQSEEMIRLKVERDGMHELLDEIIRSASTVLSDAGEPRPGRAPPQSRRSAEPVRALRRSVKTPALLPSRSRPQPGR